MPKRKIKDFIKIKIKKSHRPCVMHTPLIPKLGRQSKSVTGRNISKFQIVRPNLKTHTHTHIHTQTKPKKQTNKNKKAPLTGNKQLKTNH